MGCRLWGRTESDTTEATQQQQRLQLPRPEELTGEMGTPTFSAAKCHEDSRWIMQEGGGAFTGTPETDRLCPVRSWFPGLPATPGRRLKRESRQ